VLSKIELTKNLSDLQKNNENYHQIPYDLEIDDLFFLYSLVRERAVTSILEFGTGWSTYVLALSLNENRQLFGESHIRTVRHPNPFKMLTIDASLEYQNIAIERIPEELLSNVEAVVSTPTITQFDGVLCHKFDHLPNFTPDLIYLDGPDHGQVHGDINGFRYLESYTQPIAADILAIEPYLWPETLIVTDGRTANARFLADRFKRNWQVLHDPFGDRTIFRLSETPMGQISEQHINFRLERARQVNQKEIPEGFNSNLGSISF